MFRKNRISNWNVKQFIPQNDFHTFSEKCVDDGYSMMCSDSLEFMFTFHKENTSAKSITITYNQADLLLVTMNTLILLVQNASIITIIH